MTEQTWNAQVYDRSFGFISGLGRDLIELLDVGEGDHVLDLGCGTGEHAAEMAARGAQVLGIDADADMLAKARRDHPEVEFRLADAHTFTLPGPVDAVLSNAALHWMLEPAAVIARVRAALRDGGRFVGELGGAGNVATIRAAVTASIEAAGADTARITEPWYFPTTGEYATRLEAGGFRVRMVQHFDRPTPLENGDAGLGDWMRMFCATMLEVVPAAERDAVVQDAVERCRRHLFHDGRWFADYVRLRFVASAEAHPGGGSPFPAGP